jgi:hypothetical protein
MAAEYTSIALINPDTDHEPALPDPSAVTAISGISFRRRGADYSPGSSSPVGSHSSHRPTLRTGAILNLFSNILISILLFLVSF